MALTKKSQLYFSKTIFYRNITKATARKTFKTSTFSYGLSCSAAQEWKYFVSHAANSVAHRNVDRCHLIQSEKNKIFIHDTLLCYGARLLVKDREKENSMNKSMRRPNPQARSQKGIWINVTSL